MDQQLKAPRLLGIVTDSSGCFGHVVRTGGGLVSIRLVGHGVRVDCPTRRPQ